MHALKLRKSSFFSTLVLYLLVSGVLLFTYIGQIEEANAYIGMKPWSMSIIGYMWVFIGLPILAWIISHTKGYPSDFFKIFYGTITVNSFLVLHSVFGPLSAIELFSGVVILFSPLLMIEVMGALLPVIRMKGGIKSAWIEWLLVIVLLLVLMSAAVQPPASAGFGIDHSYDRRLEGRDIYSAGSWMAYGLSMGMNGFAPYLAFRAGLRLNFIFLGLTLAAAVFFYWLLGVKAPILYVLAALVMGILVKRGNNNFGKYFLTAIVALGLVVLFEWMFLDTYSFTADYFFRRLFADQAQVLGCYLKFVLEDKAVFWSSLYGFVDPTFEVTYYIGDRYFDNAQANVNVNAFFYQLASKGIFGYCYSVVLVPFFLVMLDRIYKSSCNPSYIFLGFLYGLLVVEQAFTVAMVSSGVGVLFFITLFEQGSDSSLVKI